MKKAVIFGTGDFAQVAFCYLRDDSDYEIAAFTVDRQYATESELLGVPVVAFEDIPHTLDPKHHAAFLAVGFSKLNANRRAAYEKCKAAGFSLPTYVNSTVKQWNETQIGEASFIFENNVLQPFVSIGNNCVLWSGNHIGHHSRIGDNVFIASHVVVSGKCTIEDNCFIGVNATFRDGITIGRDCIVGAGAIVLKDLPSNSVLKTISTTADTRRSEELRHF